MIVTQTLKYVQRGGNLNKKRTLSNNEKQIFLDLKPSDITKSVLTSFFADRFNVISGKIIPSRFNTYDEFVLHKGEYPTITENTLTNCGLFIVNKFLFEEDWIDIVGYTNIPMDKKQLGKLDNMLIKEVEQDETGEVQKKYIKYLNKLTWIQLTFHTEICTSLSIKASKPLPKVQKRKEELIKLHKKELEDGDVVVAAKIQDELISLAKEELKGDQSLELYESGARGAFDNAYRQEQLIKGPVYNDANKKFEIVTNSLYEGAGKNDLPAFANAVVAGLYPKSIGTAESGYDAKKFNAGLQSQVLDEKGTDCKSQVPMILELTKDNVSEYKYHYIVEGSKYVRLDDSNMDQYIGKTVKLRFPSTCVGKNVCNICAGDRFYLLGIRNIGITANRLANTLLNGKMKMSHDTTVRTFELDPDFIFTPNKK